MIGNSVILGALASGIGLMGYLPYIRDTIRGTTKPHVFSWFVWGILTAIAFFAQFTKGAGAGAWATGLTAIICFFVTALALRQGEKDIKSLDWLSLAGAGVSLFLWWLTRNPLSAVILIILVDAFGFVPTFRKAFHKPYEETLIQYFLAALKWIISLFALEAFNVTTWLFPASLALFNSSFTVMVFLRRRMPE